MYVKPLQLCLTLWDPVDHSPPGSSVHRLSRQECLSGLPCPPPGDLPDPGLELVSRMSPAMTGGFFTTLHLCHLKSPGRATLGPDSQRTLFCLCQLCGPSIPWLIVVWLQCLPPPSPDLLLCVFL